MPGRTFVLAAMLKTLVDEDLVDRDFLNAHARDEKALWDALVGVDVDDYAKRAGVDPELVRTAARRIGTAGSASSSSSSTSACRFVISPETRGS